jgi:hypothetical protein
MLVFALAHLAAIALLALISYVLGRRLTYRFPYSSTLEAVSFSAGLGLGVIGLLTTLLAAAGLLQTVPALIAVLLLQLACWQVWRDLARGVLSAPRRWAIAAGVSALLIAALAPYWLLALYPPSAFDATMFHLAAARIYADNHALVFAQYLRFPLFPQTNEMLFALALLLADDITAQLIQFLMVVLTAVALCAWGQRAFSLQAGLWAAGLWLSNPMVVLLGGIALVDAGLALFGCLGVYAFFTWARSRQTTWLVLAGVFGGLAASTKHTALIVVGMLGLVTIYFAIRDRRWTYPLIFGTLALGIPAFWYVRSLYYSGNPVEPLLPQIFGYSLWNESDWHVQMSDWLRRGTGKDLGSLFLLPWHLATRQQLFGSDPPLNTVVYFALPLSLYWAIRSAYIRWLLALVAAFYLIWFYNAQIQRYLMVILPAFMLLTATSFDRTLLWATSLLRRPPVRALVTTLGLLLAIAPGWLYAAGRIVTTGPIPTTRAERDAYLARKLPSYPAHQWLNAQRGSDYRLYGLYDEDMDYYTHGTYIGNTLGIGRFADIVDSLDTGQDLYNALARFNVDYFLVNTARKEITLPEDEFFRSHFRLVYQVPETGLYEVVK